MAHNVSKVFCVSQPSSWRFCTEPYIHNYQDGRLLNPKPPCSQVDGRGMYATSEGGAMAAETGKPESAASVPSSASASARDSPLDSLAAEPAIDQNSQAGGRAQALDAEVGNLPKAGLESKQGATHSASEVLRSHSESGDFHSQGLGFFPPCLKYTNKLSAQYLSIASICWR